MKIKTLIILLFLPICFFAQEKLNEAAMKQCSEFSRLARESFRAGDFSKSVDLYNKSLQINPNYFHAYYGKSQALLAGGESLDSVVTIFNKIEIVYLKFIEIEKPDDPNKYFYNFLYERGLLHYANNDFKNCINDFTRVFKMWDKDDKYGPNFQMLTLLGNAYFAVNKIDSAVTYYNLGFELEENDEAGIYIKEDFYDQYLLGDVDSILNVLTGYMNDEFSSYWAYMYSGEIRAEQGDFTGALKNFKKAAELKPTTHNWINKADLEWKIGDKDQAKKDFAAAMAINIEEAYNIEKDVAQHKKDIEKLLMEYVVETSRQLIEENKN